MKAVAPHTGVLVVVSDPAGAQVALDGRIIGVTPLTLNEAPAGEHALRVELGGRERWTRAIRVVAGRMLMVSASLRPAARP